MDGQIWKAAIQASGWIDEGVAKALEATKGALKERAIPSLSVELIKSCVPNSHCSPTTATTLFFVLANAHPFDQFLIGNSLSTLMFTAEDGSWQLGFDLLKDRNATDEGLCMSFAASRNLLHNSYTSTARNFVIERGGRWNAAPNTIASWIFWASRPATREAGLRYLLYGAQSYAVREQLRAGLVGTWLESIETDSAALAPFSPDERQQLVAMLNPGILESPQPPIEPTIQRFVVKQHWKGSSSGGTRSATNTCRNTRRISGPRTSRGASMISMQTNNHG